MKIENIENQKALFIVGGPGSGKDFLINNIVLENSIPEVSIESLYSKIKMFTDHSMIVNGNAENLIKIQSIKENLEKRNYSCAMVYVYTSDEASKARNDQRINSGAKTFSEETRQVKYNNALANLTKFEEMFGDNLFIFDNSENIDQLTEEKQTELNQWMVELEEGISKFFSKIKENNFRDFKKKIVEQQGSELDVLFEELVDEKSAPKAKKKLPGATQTPALSQMYNSRMGGIPSLAVGLSTTEAYKPSDKLIARTKYLVKPQLSKMLQDRLAARKAENQKKPKGKGYIASPRTLAIAAMRKAQMSKPVKEEKHYVMAHRSGGSQFGAASAPLKGEGGKIKHFASKEEAKAHANELNNNTKSMNVHYSYGGIVRE